MKAIQVNAPVLERHVLQGQRITCKKCAVALALLEGVPGIVDVSTGRSGSDFTVGAVHYTVHHTASVKNFITEFDNAISDIDKRRIVRQLVAKPLSVVGQAEHNPDIDPCHSV